MATGQDNWPAYTRSAIRGRLVPFDLKAASGSAGADALTFQYNPTSISDSKSADWAMAKVPGGDDALATFGSGESPQIKFELFLNEHGESYQFRRENDGYVDKAIAFLYRHLETDKTGVVAGGRAPRLLLLALGKLQFPGAAHTVESSPALLVRLVSVDVERTIFDKATYQTRRATAKITLVRHVGFPR